jgi:hypothetical protein
MDLVKTFLNPGWVGSLISLSGLIAALIIYRASRVGARPVFQAKVLRLLSKENPALPSEVEVYYQGSPVPRLTRVHIIIWNSGTRLLRGTDIVQEDPLRFVVDSSGKILNASLVKTTRGTNKFAVSIVQDRPNELLCQFDYLDPGDGATIELLHTSERARPKCSGTIRAVPAGILDWGPSRTFTDAKYEARLARMMRSTQAYIPVFGAFLIAFGIYLNNWYARVPLLLFGIIYLLGGLFDWRSRRRAPRLLRLEDS